MAQRIVTTMRIVEELNGLLENEARRKGVSKNALIIEILWNYFKQPT